MRSALHTICSTLKKIWEAGAPTHILVFGASLGDNLLLTVLARELRRRGSKSVWIKCDYPELYRNNPYVTLIIPFHTLLSRAVLGLFGTKIVHLQYSRYDRTTDRNTMPEKHIVLKMADELGLKGPISIRPDFFLSEEEARAGIIDDRQIAITVSNVGASSPSSTKDWINERYQQLVDHFCGTYRFVQLGSANDHPLSNVLDLRGKTTVRESAAILNQSALLIGYAGFTMHLARSVDCPAVIIYGGREKPTQTGYRAFCNMTSAVPCSPCWLSNRCDFEKKCMTDITAEDVIPAITGILAAARHLKDDILIND